MTNYKLKLFNELKNKTHFQHDISEDFCADFNTESEQYLCDYITSFADGAVDIYYSDIAEWGAQNADAVNDAIAEFGWDGCGSDFYKAIQTAQFVEYQNNIYCDLPFIINQIFCDMLDSDEDGDDGETAQAWRKLDEEKQNKIIVECLNKIGDTNDNNRITIFKEILDEYKNKIIETAQEV